MKQNIREVLSWLFLLIRDKENDDSFGIESIASDFPVRTNFYRYRKLE